MPEEPQQFPPFFNPAMYEVERANIMMSQLDPSKILEELEHRLRGEVWDFSKNQYVQKREPMMNEHGISIVMSIVEPRISKIIIMSNLTEQDIMSIIKDFNDNLIDLLLMNYEVMGINKKYLSVVRGLIDDTVYITLKRALEEGERSKIYPSEKLIVTPSAPQERRGVMGLFPKI